MSIKHAVLGLLNYRDMYGYEIKELIENNFTNMWTVNYGQIYTSLKALVEEGYIVLADVVPSQHGAPNKKLYSLTDNGREEFINWLRSSPEKKLLHRDPFLMRFIFMGYAEKEDALRLIEEQILLNEQQLAKRKEEMSRWADRGQYVALAREFGVTYLEMRAQWLRKALDTIRNSQET